MLREIHDEFEYRPQGRQPLGIGKVNIKVVGVGGGGSNAVDRMYSDPIDTVDYIVMNTDAQALELATVPTGLRVGDTTARGMGVGGDPSQGRICHEENREEIAEVLDGADLVFVTLLVWAAEREPEGRTGRCADSKADRARSRSASARCRSASRELTAPRRQRKAWMSFRSTSTR